jgi:hypothetical protein
LPFFLSVSLWEEMWVGTAITEITSQYQSIVADKFSASAQQPQDKRRQHKATSKQANEEVSDVTGDVHVITRSASDRLST